MIHLTEMPFIDPEASALIRELREQRGLSPEALADEIDAMIAREGDAWKRGSVDAYTIRRIEGIPGRADRPGFVPGTRVQFVLAYYFDLLPHEIWKPARRVKVTA